MSGSEALKEIVQGDRGTECQAENGPGRDWRGRQGPGALRLCLPHKGFNDRGVSVSLLKSSEQKMAKNICVITTQMGSGWGQTGGSRETRRKSVVTTSPDGGPKSGGQE